jgi:hypothetical protein
MTDRDDSPASEPVVLHIREGGLKLDGSWIYVWAHASKGAVVYVGTTNLPPVLRTWMHIHDPNPDIGRVAAHYPPAGGEMHDPLDVIAFTVPVGLSRPEVKRCLVNLLAERDLLAATYFGDQPADDVFGPGIEEFCVAVVDQMSGLLGAP